MSAKVSVWDLKKKLRSMNLPTSGLKAELVHRLREAGVRPETCLNISVEPEEEGTVRSPRSVAATNDAVSRPASTISEAELLRRERDLAEREVQLLRRELELLRVTPQVASRSPIQTAFANWREIKDMIADYDGVSYDFNMWEKQVTQLIQNYTLAEEAAKALICHKLGGKVLKWFHTRSDCVEMSHMDLLAEIRKMFGRRASSLSLRKEFEARTWAPDEVFADYLHDKITLANRVPVANDELVDYVIDGIPNEGYQTQARIQCFKSTDALLTAFEKVVLPQEWTRPERGRRGDVSMLTKKLPRMPREPKDDGKQRCYNCNMAGHFSKDCPKPRRERGSCFICGQFGHRATNCGKPTSTTGQVNYVAEQREDDDEFLRSVDLHLGEKNELSFSVTALLDSGSPVSFIKDKCIPKYISRHTSPTTDFCGINNSHLRVLGSVNAKIVLNEQKCNISLCVVPNETMRKNLVLGRDFMKTANLTLVCRETQEIMNIEMSSDAELSTRDIIVNEDLPVPVKRQTREIFRDSYVTPTRPEKPSVENIMKLTITDEKPFHCTPRRLACTEKIKLREILDSLLERGIIRESTSEYASPIVLLKKKTGETRMCVDFRILNKVSARDNFPIPLIEDQLNVLAGKRYFTTLDLKDGFFHITMHDDSIKYTSFVTPLGQFEYLKMPFGLKGAPLKFQRFVTTIFKNLITSGDVSVYLDDFLIATTTIDHHLRVLRKVFALLVENKLELRLDKCKFLQTKLDYLGYTITSEGVSPTERGIEAIKNFPIPRNVRDIQSFLGLCSYFRKFIENFSIRAKPLYDLTRKDSKFKFEQEEMQTFERLKAALVDAPILSIYSPQDETELHCDASAVGFGAILMQRKADHKFHPVFYFSKRTTPVESKYHSFELETLAIVYALRRFRVYLTGVTFKIITDCQALSMTLNKKDTNPRISRWALEMQSYDYTLEHRIGARMAHVDALSRQILVVEDNSFDKNLALCQEGDEVIVNLRNLLEKSEHKQYELRDGLVYRKYHDQLLFCVPSSMQSSVMHRYHNEFGHVGVDKTLQNIMSSYWFPDMKNKINNHIKACLKCIAFSPDSGKPEGILHCIPKGDKPFKSLHIDHLGPLSKASNAKKRFIFAVVDGFTKFVKLYATKTTNTTEVINCLRSYFTTFSRPLQIVSDRGSSFTSHDFQNFTNEYGVQHVKVATASPQANGQVERVNRSIIPMIAKLSDERKVQWFNVLSEVEFVYNNTVNRSTGECPSVLLYGVKQRGKVNDSLRDYLESIGLTNEKRELDKLRQDVDKKIQVAQAKNRDYYDRKHRIPTKYAEGDKVMIRNFDNTPGVCAKLTPRYKGPYVVSKVLRNDRYIIQDIDGHQFSQIPYQGTWEAANLRRWLPS